MRTRGVKKSPGPRKGTKTPTKVSGDESEVEAEAFEAGVSEAEHLQVDVKMDGDGRVIEVPSSDAEIELDIDLKSESRDANAKASTVAGTDYTAGVASVVSAEASGHVIGASLDPFEVEIGAKNVKFDEEMSEMPKETEAVNTADDEGDEKLERNNEGEEVKGIEEDCSQIEDEVEDEYEDDDEKDGEKVNDYVDVDHSYEVENFKDNATGKDNEISSVHTLSVMHYSKAISECRKQKRREVFIGGLNKEATEEEIRAVFEKVGKVSEIRLIRNLKSGKNKGYAFVRYADPLEAGKAVDELSRAEVHGQPCRVLPSEENDILYLGNIGKDWRKENVIETLKKYDVESVEDVTLIEDPQNEECHQGFGFLEFSTHSDALKAFKRLQKPDAIFGGETSAKVAWAQLLDEPDEAVMLQVKSVFLDGIPSAWDEQRVKELCGKYGEIEEVDLGHKKSSSKKKKFGFIKYATREGAMACIMAINYSEVVEGEQKVTLRARLAKPVQKRRGVTRGIRGGFPIGQDVGGQVGAGSARKDRESKDHVRKRIGKSRSQRKGQKANIVETLASRSGDQVNEDTASLEQTLSIGETASLRPQKKSRKNKRNLSRRNSFAATEEGAYAQNAGRAGVRNYDADRYCGNVGGYRESRGRKRSYSDLFLVLSMQGFHIMKALIGSQ
ncbi:hypothetical protein O6H91_21G072900 [Diphasiastrum complanatum]|uniref:Uncharacterized protein n=1 Tax=Diphasiastrum complanatum TaxID=34168 RepID=A0ACC2ANH6_DIPCM|nr:hypothetical protein O6H91_21G072900 [Diphasiastrum complanatum]